MAGARIATWVIAFVVGGVYGVAGTVGQASTLAGIPVGLLVSVIGCAALLVAVRALTADRWATLATGLGIIAAVLVFSGRGPGGSVIVPDGEIAMVWGVNVGMVWNIAVPVLVALVVAWPDRGAREEQERTEA